MDGADEHVSNAPGDFSVSGLKASGDRFTSIMAIYSPNLDVAAVAWE